MQVMYQDIWTMPIYNWFMVLDENNFGFLNESSTFVAPDSVEKESSKEHIDRWHEITNQLTKQFGQSEANKTILEKKRDLGLLKTKYLITGNKMNLTFIEIKENEIETHGNKGGDFNYNKEVGILGKFIGKPINTRNTTVHEYHTIKELLKNG